MNIDSPILNTNHTDKTLNFEIVNGVCQLIIKILFGFLVQIIAKNYEYLKN